MPFDPSLPANGSPDSSAEMRGQLTGLFDLIQAIPTPPTPITSFVVDATNTLPPGENASVTVGVEAPVVHFTFNIPRGATGAPGEVTETMLQVAIAGTPQNPGSLTTLDLAISDPPTQAELQAVANKLDQLINALKRV